MKVSETLFFMFRNPIPLIVHLTCWFLLAAWGIVADDPFIIETWPRVVKIMEAPASVGDFLKAASIIWDEVIDNLTRTGFWMLVVTPPFFICYREAVGNLKGISDEHQIWMGWYHRQQDAIAEGDNFMESSPPLKNMRVNSYFRKAQKTLLFMIRNPKLPLIHFLCWFFTCFLLILITILPDFADVVRTVENFARNFLSAASYLAIVAAIFGFISSYQETRGTVKGIAKAQQAWAAWYHQQQEAKAHGAPFDVSPPLFRVYSEFKK